MHGASGSRTYVVLRYARYAAVSEVVTPLGTLRARTHQEARARAPAAWPGEPAEHLRVWRASACRTALLIEALAADGADLRRRGGSNVTD